MWKTWEGIQYWLRAALMMCVGLGCAGNAVAAQCVDAQVRELTDAVSNLQTDQAQAVLAALHEAKPDYPLLDFFKATIKWSARQLAKKPSKRRQALNEAVFAVQALDKTFNDTVNPPKREALRFQLALAEGFAARMSAFDEAYLQAWRLGSSAKGHIDAIVEKNPHHADAQLFLGLFEIYTASMPDDFSWLGKLIAWEGKHARGVTLLEAAVERAPMLAHEAARALLMEVAHDYPESCNYLPLAELMQTRSGNNPYFSFSLQHLYLRCGFPQKAQVFNAMLDLQGVENPLLHSAQIKAALRTHAQLGEVEAIMALGEARLPKNERYAYFFALADAHDVRGERDKASAIYARLANKHDIDARLQHLASVRLQRPYRAPVEVTPQRQWQIAAACQ